MNSTTREIFEAQRKRRFGTANPEQFSVPHWEYMVRTGVDPYAVCESVSAAHTEGPPGTNPDWCFRRFGMSRTLMPDGRIICIAGEHEDFYDPDFCIYNDVIILRPAPGQSAITLESGSVEIYGYPESLFPPTDFHSATLVGDRIVLIGRLGYHGKRLHGATPVYALNTSTYTLEEIRTSGSPPGWLFGHSAHFDAATGAITVRGGQIELNSTDRDLHTNFSAYRLHASDWRWELLVQRERHRRFILEVDENDDLRNHLPESAFRPARVPHDMLAPEARGCDVYFIMVAGVRITFSAIFSEVQVFVEGDLPPDLVNTLIEDLQANFRAASGCRWHAREVDSFPNPEEEMKKWDELMKNGKSKEPPTFT